MRAAKEAIAQETKDKAETMINKEAESEHKTKTTVGDDAKGAGSTKERISVQISEVFGHPFRSFRTPSVPSQSFAMKQDFQDSTLVESIVRLLSWRKRQ